MQAKEYMLRIERIEQELKIIAARKRHYMELATSIGNGGGAISSTPTGTSRVEIGAVALADLRREMESKEQEYTELVRKAEKLIDRIPQENFRKVLKLRYLAGLSFRSVSDEMGYKDEKSVYRVHGYALSELQKAM